MPVHPAMSSRFPLFEGVPSMQALMEDPQYERVRAELGAHPDYQVPDVRVRSDAAPGPHGPVPVRVYADGDDDGRGAGERPCLVWMHGGAFIAGDLDMPEADWFSREVARRAGAVVVSVDYRLCNEGVHYPVPHDDVVAAIRWARESAPELGIDPGRVSAGGASAGANLAAGVALKLRDADVPYPSESCASAASKRASTDACAAVNFARTAASDRKTVPHAAASSSPAPGPLR